LTCCRGSVSRQSERHEQTNIFANAPRLVMPTTAPAVGHTQNTYTATRAVIMPTTYL
jgi:hypothetical protein